MDENLTLDDPSALDAPVEDTQPSLALNMPEASPIVYPVQQTSNPLDKVSADIAAKRAALAALPPIQRRVIDLSRIWTAPTEIPKPQDFTSYAGDKYSALDTSAKQSVWDGYVRSELPKSLPAGYTPEQLAAAKARFEASNPRPQDTGFYSYLKSGVASTTNAVSSAVSTKTPESLARSTIANIKDQIDDPEIAALQKNIAQQVKDAGGSTLWNELKVRTAEYATNPRLFAKMAIQQLPNSIPALAGAIAGGKAGAIAGGAAGTFVIPGIGTVGGGAVGGAVGAVVGGFLGGVAPEYGSDLVQRIQTEAQAAGVDVRNQTALEAFIKERGVDHFTDPALRKGVGTAATDSVFNALVVGRLGSVASTQAKVILKTEADLAKGVITADQAAVNLAKAQGRIAAAQAPLTRVTHAAGTSGIEALGEGVSEAAGRFYADNKIDWGDVADETLFGLAHGTAFEAGGKVWSAATGAASEYDQAVAKLNARLAPPATPSATATATTPAATDTTLPPEAPAAEPTATDTTPVLPTIDDAAIARLKEIVPDFNETANITENGALSLDPDQTAALQQVIENLPAADQQFLYDLALGVNANETTSTETNPAANQQTAVSAQETIPGSTAPTSSDTVGVSGLPTDGSGASTGAVLDGRPASENRTDTGPAASEVIGGPVVDNVNTTSTEGPGSPGIDGTGTTPAVITQGNENATNQINQQESVQQQRSPGDQARQAPEAGRRNRVQRAEQSAAPQEKVTTQNVTEKTLESLRLRAEEVLARLSTEETISVRDYFEQVQPPDDGGKVSIRTEMRKLLGDLEARVEQGDVALRAGKQALTADETRALHDEITGGIVYATTADLAKNVPLDNLVERALKNNDIRGALTVMTRTASTPLSRAVGSRLLSQVTSSTKIVVGPVNNVDTTKLGGKRASGSYQHSTNTITLDPNANGLSERTLLHEVTHAATLEAIRNPDTAVKRAAVKELQRIMVHAKKELEGAKHYGFTNLEEFVAEAFSNPVFQHDLYNIKTGPKVSLWSRVVNAVLKSTGLDKIIGLVNDDNLLGKTLTAADLLMQPASAKTTDGTKAVAANQGEPTTAPLWRSALTEATNKAPFEKNAASQWKTWLQSNAAKLGVKKDEIEWSGITDWLDLQQGKVTREQVQQYLDQNGVKVTETELGLQTDKAKQLEAATNAASKEFERYLQKTFSMHRDDAARHASDAATGNLSDKTKGYLGEQGMALATKVRHAYQDELIGDPNAETKYGKYQLPGGENYRELLLTLPAKEETRTAKIALADDGIWGVEWSDGDTNEFATEREARDFVRAGGNGPVSGTGPNFRSSHWSQPNILAHIRFNERTDADGKKVLFIEEIQSDWGQAGKKQGFQNGTTTLPDGWTVFKDEKNGYYVINDRKTQVGAYGSTEAEAIKNALGDTGVGLVPRAPFVGKTEAWVSLALKRMIRYAVDNGFDRVAMVNGEQSAERYDLSKQVDTLSARKNTDGNYSLRITRPGNRTSEMLKSNALEAELPDLIGKELAQKIVNDAAASANFQKDYSGLDLKVGGEGMKAFYDKIVPQVANDVLKKLGGGKVESVSLGSTSKWSIVNDRTGEAQYWYDQADAKELATAGAERFNKDAKITGGDTFTAKQVDKSLSAVSTQPGFDITPAMKEHAEQGMLLFAPTDLAAQTETDLAALQGGRKPTIGIQNESVGTKLRTMKAAAREALIDYQVPIYNWLESIYGAGKAATNATWQTLKTIGPKRDELNHQFKIGTLHDINMVGKELATKYGLKIEEAVSTLGEYAKYVHVPEANATLLARLQKAANDANADLRNATTDLALAQQEYDQAKLDVKSKKAPVANAKTFSRADAELKQATKAYNDAVKTRDAADAALQSGPDRQAGHLTDAQAQDSKAYLESKYDVALLQKGQQLLVKANRDALDASVRAGVIDAKTAASLKATYPNYVPLFVDKDSLGTDPWSAMDGAPDLFSQSINATLIKERKGYLENSDVRSDNAYINTIAKVAATNSRVAAQPFKNQLLVMALNKDAGKELSIKPLRGNNPDPRGMVAKDSKGQQYQVMFKSDQLADAVYSRGVEEFGSTGLPGMIANVGSIIARSVTQYTLAFAPVNLVRDVGEKTLLVRSRKFLDANGKPVDGRALAGTMTKLLATDFLSVITSINQAVRDKAPATPGKYYDLIKEMMSEGGLSTWGDIFQKSRIEVLNEVKKLQGWRRLPAAFNDVVHKYNHTFDMMSSTLAYTAMKQAGMTPRAAAFATMDLMNFRNKGKKTGWIRALYLFANPALQSGANFIDHVKTKQGKIDAVVLGVLALAFYQLALMTGDDDELLGNEIDQRNTTEIERSMVFMVDGVPVKVPVPYGMAQIMWAFAVNGTRFARGVTSGADAIADSLKSTFKSISPISPSEIEATKNPLMFMVQTLTPSTLRPIVDVATNTSAFGAPITKPRLNPKIPASAQGRENTEGFWKDTAKKLYEITGADVAPEKIKAMWLGYTAGPIADATKALTFDKDEKGLTTSFRDDLRYLMPFGFNRFVGGDSTFLQAKYYDSLKQAENLVKKYGLAEVDSNRALGTGGKVVARKAILDKAPGITDNDKKLVAAYYAERLIVTKEGQSKKKDLSRAKTPESIADINSKYEDTSEARMRDFLSRLK